MASEDCDHRTPSFRGVVLPTGQWRTTTECQSCGEWLPLGPSRDDGEHAEAVAIEIRAAEFAARPVGSWCTNDAWSGWYARERDWEPFQSRDAIAGYLARCIATHDEDSNG